MITAATGDLGTALKTRTFQTKCATKEEISIYSKSAFQKNPSMANKSHFCFSMYPSLPSSALTVLAVAQGLNQWLVWGTAMGLLPFKQQVSPRWMFPRRIGNKTKFLSFFFSDKPFHGQFSQDDPIIILQRRLPPPNPMGGLSEGKTKRKRKGNGGVVKGGRCGDTPETR